LLGKHPATKILFLTPSAVPVAGDQDPERPMTEVPAAENQEPIRMNMTIAVPAAEDQEPESPMNTIIIVLLSP
jgi:hypothetical protein